MKEVKKAVITAAGFGSRFLPITKTIPKEMLPILDKPIIHWIVKECAGTGIEEIIIVAAPDEVKIFEDYFYGHAENIRMMMQLQGKMDRWAKVAEIFKLPNITIVPEDRTIPYGNGRPILTVKHLLAEEEAFVVCFGDDLVLSEESAVKQLVDFYTSSDADAVMQVTGQFASDPERLTKGGVIKIKEGTENQLDFVIEKPPVNELPSTMYSYGRFIISNQIFEYLNPEAIGKDGEVWLQDANAKLAKNAKFLVQELKDGTFVTTGDPKSYLLAQEMFAEKYL